MRIVQSLFIVLSIGLLTLAVAACDSDQPETSQDEQAGAQVDDGAEDSAPEKVEVADDGTEFEPPVEKGQIPEGAWICDMGTVHYARMSEGDGSCPLCGMDLVRHGEHGHHGDHDHHGEHHH